MEGTVTPDDDPPQDMGDPDKEVGVHTYTKFTHIRMYIHTHVDACTHTLA